MSKLRDFVRGIKELDHGTMTEWKEWRELSKKTNPIRYWIAEDGFDYLEDIITFPYRWFRKTRSYLKYRFMIKTHALTSNMKRGEWLDYGDRFIPCLFDELINFIEVEKTWEGYDPKIHGKYHSFGWRNREAGLDHLKWESTLTFGDDPTPQAKTAKEILSLYEWYVGVYLLRPNVYDMVGYNDFDKFTQDMSKEICLIETTREEHDTEMLIRLIKIRNGLWS